MSNQDGIATLIVVFYLAIFAGITITLSLTATNLINITKTVTQRRTAEQIARSGLEVWISQVINDLSKDGDQKGVVVTEFMKWWPDRGLDIVRYSASSSPQYVEVFNPIRFPVTLSGYGSESEANTSNVDKQIPPGKSVLICAGSGRVFGVACDLQFSGGLSRSGEGFYVKRREGHTIDAVGLRRSRSNYKEGNGLALDNREMNIRRKKGTTTGYQQSPDDTDNNENDFVEVDSARDLGVPKTGYGDPDPAPADANEYIEIANLGDTVDPVGNRYSFKDSLDGEGNPIGAGSYRLVSFPGYPNSDNTRLGSQQVGLVLPVDADTRALGVEKMANNGKIQLYSLLDKSGNYSFLTDGLHDDWIEQFTFDRGADKSTRIIRNISPKDYHFFNPWHSLEKINPWASNKAANWTISSLNGTPGRLRYGIDAHTDPWGLGGNLTDDVRMDERIYFPSLEDSFQKGDRGYFKFLNIEDETGKLDLRSPKNWKTLTTEKTHQRTVSKKVARRITTMPDTFWGGTASLIGIKGVGFQRLQKYNPVYSAYRNESSDGDRININTAAYEALRGIQINPNTSKKPAFLTDEMARTIIERRSGNEIGTSDPDGDGVIELTEENYRNGFSRPFFTTLKACEVLKSMEDQFDCFTFSQNTTVQSEGIFYVRLKGVYLHGPGDPRSETEIEAIVSRKPIVNDNGRLQVLMKRVD